MTTDEPAPLSGDADVLRRVLAGLRDEPPRDPEVAAVLSWPGHRARRAGQGSGGRRRSGMPEPPVWAAHSVIEDGGLTHERVSRVHPVVMTAADPAVGEAFACPTDVSLSVVDQPSGQGWTRSRPTIQVEAGSYSAVEARRLVQAIQELLSLVR